MGRPLILYGVDELTNHSFEDDAPATDPPTGWDDSLSVGGENAVTAAEAQSPGLGFPSVQSVQQNTTSGAGGNKAVLIQRSSADDARLFLQAYGGGEIAAAALLKGADANALVNAQLSIEQYSGGTSTPQSGSLEAPASSRTITAEGDDDWDLRVAAEEIHADTDWVDVILDYDISRGSFNGASDAFWDRVYLGAVLDLEAKGFRQIDDRVEGGFGVNHGDKVTEVVKITSAKTRFDVSIDNVLVGVPGLADADLKRFLAWLGSPQVGRSVIWSDRQRHTNDAHHFTAAYHDRRVRIRTPRGVELRRYRLRFEAQGETP